jgi:hypothetical protein
MHRAALYFQKSLKSMPRFPRYISVLRSVISFFTDTKAVLRTRVLAKHIIDDATNLLAVAAPRTATSTTRLKLHQIRWTSLGYGNGRVLEKWESIQKALVDQDVIKTLTDKAKRTPLLFCIVYDKFYYALLS